MSLNGCVDVLKETEISGWAADKSNLARQVSVEIYVNAVLVVVLRCSLFRDDLLNAGLGDGRKAFHFDPGRYLSAGTNTVEIRHAGATVRLANGSGQLFGISGTNLRNLSDSDLNRLHEVSQQRWKGSEADVGLTWGEIFSGDSFVDALQSHLNFDGSPHICEIGPGYGRLLKSILERRLPFRKYTGVELSQERVRALKAKFAMEYIEFIQGDVNTVRLSEKADLVICSATFEHLFPDLTMALTNLVAQNANRLAMLAIDFIQSDDAIAYRSQGFERDGNAFVRIYSSDELRHLYASCGISVVKLDSIVLGRSSYGDVRRIFVFSRAGALDEAVRAPVSGRG